MGISLWKSETSGYLVALSRAEYFQNGVEVYWVTYYSTGAIGVILVPSRYCREKCQNSESEAMWTMFVLVSSLVSTVHFSAMYVKAVMLRPVLYGQA